MPALADDATVEDMLARLEQMLSVCSQLVASIASASAGKTDEQSAYLLSNPSTTD